MARYEWIVMSDCDPEHRDGFNQWYDEIHIPDLLKIPGVVSARRFDLSTLQAMPDPQSGELIVSGEGALPGQLPYLAIYEFETDDAEGVLKEIVRRGGTPDMEISEHLRDVNTYLYKRM